MPKLRVAIIGAGPSGFAVAEVLRSPRFSKHFDITIYERNNYVGGKCCTVLTDGSIANGKPGGYEMGAVMIAKYAPSYRALNKLIERYDIEMHNFKESERPISAYFAGKRRVPIKDFHWSDIFTKRRMMNRRFSGYEHYMGDYLQHMPGRHAGFDRQSRFLNSPVSKLYNSTVNRRLCGVMQGFGYADLDDRNLSPPLMYYHHYLEPTGTLDIDRVVNGTQSIWSTIAASYPKGLIRLNEPVLGVERGPEKVIIRTAKDSQTYDFLVVATPLKPALEFLDLSSTERGFFSKMKHNHYVSVLCESLGQPENSRFNVPGCTDKKRLGEVVCTYKRYPDSNWLTAYLYLKPGEHADDAAIVDRVERSLKRDLDVKMINKSAAKVFHWPDYFGHLDKQSLNSGWYDTFERHVQGSDRTLYVSSGLHMETVGASVQYGTEMAERFAKRWLKSNS
jgi:hypothetical protein